MRRAELGGRHRGADDPGEGVADEGGWDAAVVEEALFEREDTEKALDGPAHGFDPAFAPRPGLGSDQVDHRNLALFQLLSEPQVSIGRVRQNSELGSFGRGGADQLAEFAPDPGDMAYHLDYSDYGKRAGVDDGADSGFLHPGTGASEELGFGVSGFDGFDQAGRIQVARGFTGGDEDAHLHPLWP